MEQTEFQDSAELPSSSSREQADVTTDQSSVMQISSSPTSHATSSSFEHENICRICLDKGTESLVAPCKCSGSAKYAHESCLLRWFFKTRRRKCELCLSEVNVKSVGFKPLQKWRLPTDSCDFVFYLFTLYCVIMFVFTGMIIWIATQGCVSPVCITLYVICSMSLVYFIYCCGCVEYSKTYWKACVTTNKNWRIYNRDESVRRKIKVARIMSIETETSPSKKHTRNPSRSSLTAMPEIEAHETPVVSYSSPIRRCSASFDDGLSSTGSTTMIQQHGIVESACGSPIFVVEDLRHTGSVSLLIGDDCPIEDWLHPSPKPVDVEEPENRISEEISKTPITKSKDEQTRSNDECSGDKEICARKNKSSFTNKGFDDTKL